ncbi:flagellar motor protein MotA [Sulfurimicrobium lacus]|uniref:Flagellar motor protein MotA n=1 Tax=Sulfurimicrobium lacus TaxID=2715678 RepID=A0A6F8VBV1_9PROT|nr:flagellar motor stator protein MotA [Sulfurimicrobium lacus]BCB26219.1 flagellar motor protein MotA [Sulfurimicrobium lacus]
MLVIVGYLVVLGSVFGGFVMAGGHLAALLQPIELLMIGGAAAGAFLVGSGPKVMKATFKALPGIVKGSKYNKALYMELLALLFEILAKVRKEGLMSIESDVEEPDKSPLFSKYPGVSSDHHIVEFITDYLRLMVGGNLNAMEIENLMDNEIETHHNEGHVPVAAFAKLADGMPAFGIVAAVMGVVHTMESVGIPPAELGMLIAHALVGTFLGILLSYGFVAPISTLLENKLIESSKVFDCVKVTLLASLNGYAPQVAVEFGRKVLYSTERPGFLELEEHVKQTKNKPG